VVKLSKNITNKDFLFGDFDKDGSKNIDDYRPFDNKINKWPPINKQTTFYHKAQFGGTEVLLSDELLALERYNNQLNPILVNFLKENPGSFGRIKTVPSTMQKLRQRGLPFINDIGGATILVNNRKQVFKVANDIKSNYKTDPKRSKNFYKNPKDGVYYAYHVGIIPNNLKDMRLEVQVKTNKMFSLQKKQHETYKKGDSLIKFIKPAKQLFDKGY
jgi:(p)ppGpp synthase/HD superfamily hydrolase